MQKNNTAPLRKMNAIIGIYAAVASLLSLSLSSSLVAAESLSSTTILTRARVPQFPLPSEVSRWSWVLPRGGSMGDEEEDVVIDDDDDDDKIEKISSEARSSIVTTIKKKKKKKQSKSLKRRNTIDKPPMEQDEEDHYDDDVDNDDNAIASETTISPTSSTARKDTISQVMKGKDAASILGDGIRQRANILRRDPLLLPTFYSYEERALDAALVSIGLSLGTAGTDLEEAVGNDETVVVETATQQLQQPQSLAYYQYGHRIDNFQEGTKSSQRRPSTASMTTSIADYFLKTHGGTHIVQFLLSIVTSGLGVTCLLLPPFPSSASYHHHLSSATTATDAAGAAVGKTTTTSSSSSSASIILSKQILLSTLKYELMQQTLTIGMAKYASGLMGAALIGASQIPKLGLRTVRRHLELVASDDPVARYLFFCSLLVVWMGWFTGGGVGGIGTAAAARGGGMRGYNARMRGSIFSIMNAASATAAASAASTSTPSSNEGGIDSIVAQEATVTTQLLNTLLEQPPPWFLSHSWGYILPFLILCPVLLREITSVFLVVSDVLSLVVSSSKSKSVTLLLGTLLSSCRTIVDGVLRVLVTSNKEWSSADSFQRQRALAILVSRCSSMMELAVGGILFWDAIQSFWNFAFLSPAATTTTATATSIYVARLPFKCVLGKCVCAHLYLYFLQSKKRSKPNICTNDRTIFEEGPES